MPNINNFYISSTARFDELSAISRIYNYLFTSLDVVYLGDNSEELCPDVYTKNFDKGIEIVTCENENFYKTHRNYFSALNRDAKFKQLFQNKRVLPLNSLNLNKKILLKAVEPINNDNLQREEKEFYDRLRLVTNKKLTNLNEGHYDGCKNLALIIFSGYERKPFATNDKMLQVINEENRKFRRKFDYIYVICNDDILQISKFGEMQSMVDNKVLKTVYQKSPKSDLGKEF